MPIPKKLETNPELHKDLRGRHLTYDGIRAKYNFTATNTELRVLRDQITNEGKVALHVKDESDESLIEDAANLCALLKKRKGKVSVYTLAEELDMSPRRIRTMVERLQEERYMAKIDKDEVHLQDTPSASSSQIDSKLFFGKKIRFGAVSDSHQCSRYAREDCLNSIYDVFKKEGIKTVYHGGNYIDGEARFNKNDIHVHGMDRQIKYFVDNYPQRKGIDTYFIAGDDHEGWYLQREGVEIGERTQDLAQRAGREDLHYLGYMEHDIELQTEEGSSSLRVMHPGGGSAYAISYQPQKIVESFSGGEKPSILLIGHYHKAEYLFYRNVHILSLGCLMDQSPFMRKKRLSAHVGGWIVEANQAPDGSINRFKCEFINFFDEDYYRKWEYQK